jgi:diguanylate cyclase (GGDEF)-like protein/PAS domain S-box-containing protein
MNPSRPRIPGRAAVLGATERSGTEPPEDGKPTPDISRRDAMLALSEQTLRGQPVADLTERVAMLAIAELGLDDCQVWELQPDDTLLLRESAGSGGVPAENRTIPLTDSLQPGFTLRAAEPVVIDDFSVETRFAPPPPLDRDCVASSISVPIPGPKPGFGVLAAHSARPRKFAARDIEFVESLGHLLGAIIDRDRSRKLLEETERRYRRLIERLPVVTYVAEYGPEGRWLFVSPQIEEMFGYTAKEWMTDPGLWFSRIHPDDRAAVAAEEERGAEGGHPLALEYRMIARDGRVVWVRDDASMGIHSYDGVLAVEGLLSDVTEAKIAEAELRRRAEHDDLTGLYNRRRFEEELADFRSLDGCKGAVALIDVDSLKYVNDALGHAAGDALLRGISHSLDGERRTGEVLARFGGDEFAMLLPVGHEDEARKRVKSFINAVRSRDSRLPATASAGVVSFDDSSEATDADLLVAADIALHEAKEHGGNRVFAYEGRESERLAWIGRVRAAIDEGGLLLLAQPIIDLADQSTVSEELLVRMIGADGEVLPPAKFLPTAERFGLIGEIDAWVISRAMELAAEGRSVAVNLSARSIGDPGLIDTISECIEKTGADPDRVVFEITETSTVTAIEDLRAFGMRIERLGCALAIDDFGTGFGSLTYLKHLPVRYLKVDTEFVRGLVNSQSDQAIVRAIVTIAASLGMRTVAEGVEDQQTADRLVDLGVDYAQGFHLGRPHPIRTAPR